MTDEPEPFPAPRVSRTTRLLIAVIAGLGAIVIALSAALIDTGLDRAAIEAERAQADYTIKQLTKRIYWLEQQLGQ